MSAARNGLTAGGSEIFRQLRGNIFQPLLPKFQEDPKLWHLREEAGHTPLHWAALSGDVPFTTAALQHLEVDIRADNLQTPLMWAVTRGRLQVAKLLMEAKADPYTKDSVGATPLILAVQHGQTSAMLLLFALCEHKALLAGVDVKGCSAAHWAAFKGELSALQLLDYFNADFSVTDNEKMSPLHRAAQGNQDGIMQFLLDRGVNASLVDRQDRTCIEVAQQLNRQKALSRLKRLLEPKPSDEE
ncbi:unnamed protein product [Effrenium voratum]|nr:unnamed protein product [Effrenium voratum]